MLPLYPGLLAFLAAQGSATGDAAASTSRRVAGSLGLFVLAGVLALMLALGAVLAATRTAVAPTLPYVLPATYLVVAALGVAMLAGRNPFARLSIGRAPGLRDPRALGTEIAYVLAFGLGFGWPLVVLPWLAQGQARRFTDALTRHHTRLLRVSGLALLAIAAWGTFTEAWPNLR